MKNMLPKNLPRQNAHLHRATVYTFVLAICMGIASVFARSNGQNAIADAVINVWLLFPAITILSFALERYLPRVQESPLLFFLPNSILSTDWIYGLLMGAGLLLAWRLDSEDWVTTMVCFLLVMISASVAKVIHWYLDLRNR